MLKRYLHNTSGNVAMTFAIGLLVMMAGVGAAIDFSAASKVRQELQSAVDAATLAGARAIELSKTDVEELITIAVAENNTEQHVISLDIDVGKETLRVTGNTSYNPVIMSMFGHGQMDVSATAESPRGAAIPIHLALVLDTTDSMEGANIDALRVAATDLLNELETADEDVQVSIVPYGEYVNIGTGYANESWLDDDKPDRFEPARVDTRPEMTPGVCTPNGTFRTVVTYRDGVPTGSSQVENKDCTPSTPTGNMIDVNIPAKTVTYNWEGCVGSRQSPRNLYPQATPTDQIMAAMKPSDNSPSVTCGTPLVTLSDDFNTLRSTISSLTTSGETYLAGGMMWGWRTLSPTVPFTQSQTAKPDTVKAIILMTDGVNTRSQPSGSEYHNGGDALGGLSHFEEICTATKGSGIQVYTVAYDIPTNAKNAAETALALTSCASSAGQAFQANNAAELKATFSAIGKALLDVRLSL